jgi:esterase/lipase superfamily enzyme
VKRVETWQSSQLDIEVRVARWGSAGEPILLFPTAGGDAEEVERFGLVGALGELVERGRARVYSCDSVPGRAMLAGEEDPGRIAWLLHRFDRFVYHELVPFIRDESGDDEPIAAAGASLGALFALLCVCRHPDAFGSALCLSGKYDLAGVFEAGEEPTLDFHYASPLHFLPLLEDAGHLALLRRRFVRLVCGTGRAERPEYAWRVARVLGALGVPNRVDVWRHGYHHDWASWRGALPLYLGAPREAGWAPAPAAAER